MTRHIQFICLLFLLAPTALTAQSKFSYSLLLNKSSSADEEMGICINSITGGECINFERNWKLNVTAAANYQLSQRVRLQSGLAYNALGLDEVSEYGNRDEIKIKYLSIPIRTHYFISQGKLSIYTGLGLRTDIRLNDVPPSDALVALPQEGRSIAISAELLVGLEYKISPHFAVNFEPTFSRGITAYNKDPDVRYLEFYTQPKMLEYPQRIGFSFGVTYSAIGSAK